MRYKKNAARRIILGALPHLVAQLCSSGLDPCFLQSLMSARAILYMGLAVMVALDAH